MTYLIFLLIGLKSALEAVQSRIAVRVAAARATSTQQRVLVTALVLQAAVLAVVEL